MIEREGDEAMTDEWERLSDGRIIRRGPGGQIEETRLPPEVAREMGQAASRRRSKDFALRVQEILTAYFGTETPPQYARELAGLVAEGRAGAVSAHRALSEISPAKTGKPVEVDLQFGDVCPTCRQFYGDLDGQTLLKLLQLLENPQVVELMREDFSRLAK